MAMQRIEELDKAFNFKPDNRRTKGFDLLYGTLDAFLLEYEGAKANTVYTLRLNEPERTPKDFERGLFMLDDGYSVKPYYVAGYSADKTELFLYPMSATMGAYLGPKTTYFLTVTNK